MAVNVSPPLFTPIAVGAVPTVSSVSSVPAVPIVAPVAQIIQSGTVGTAYSETISTVGGTSPYTFALFSGSLPAGLSLNTSTGVISGTPTTAATSTFTIKVTDANSLTGTQVFQIVVGAASTGGGNYGFVA